MPSASDILKIQRLLARERAQIIALAACARELRQLIMNAAGKKNMTLNKVCVAAKAQSAMIYGFVKGKSMILAGQNLENLCSFFDRPDIHAEIIRNAQNLQHKRAGLAKFDAETIDLVFDMQDAYTAHAYAVCNHDEFSRFFEDPKLVVGMLGFKNESAHRIQDNHMLRVALRAVLDDPTFSDRMRAYLKKIQKERMSAANEYYTLTRQLLDQHYADIEHMTAALNYHPSTHHSVLRGDIPAENIRSYTTRAKEHLEMLTAKPHPDSPPKKPPAPPHAKKEADRDNTRERITGLTLRETGGTRSCLDVEFTLNEDGFHEIDLNPGEQFILAVIQQIQIVRAMLNTCTQIRDEHTRQRVRTSLEAEVIELKISISSFSDAFPNMLTKIRDAERAFAQEHLNRRTS